MPLKPRPRLAPCGFCNSAAILTNYDPPGKVAPVSVISCTNQDCPIEAVIEGEDEEEIIRVWNETWKLTKGNWKP